MLLICDNVSKTCRCGLEHNGVGAGRVRVQLVPGTTGADTEYKFMCGFSQARGPAQVFNRDNFSDLLDSC